MDNILSQWNVAYIISFYELTFLYLFLVNVVVSLDILFKELCIHQNKSRD